MKKLLLPLLIAVLYPLTGSAASLSVDAQGNVINTTPTNFPTGKLKVNGVEVTGGGGGGGVSSVPVGNTVFVDKDGSDLTGLRERLDKPFLTLTAAKAAASSGDTIIVGPGTYNERNWQKNGVNWHFVPGATVANTTNGDVFTDAAGAVSCTISGFGIFSTTGTGSFFRISNASSDVRIECNSIIETGADVLGNSAIWQSAGTVHVRALVIEGANAAVYWSEGGTLFVDAQRITGTRTALYALDLIANVHGHVRAELISAGDFVIDHSGHATSALWVDAHRVVTTGTGAQSGIVVQEGSKLYLTAQKAEMAQVSSGAAGFHIFSGKAYIQLEKAEALAAVGGALPFIDLGDSGATTAFFRIDELVLTGLVVDAIQVGPGTNDFQIRNLTTSGNGLVSGVGAGTTAFTGTINTSASSTVSPVKIIGGSVILEQAVLTAHASADSITATSAQTVTSYNSTSNKAVNVNVTIAGGLQIAGAIPTQWLGATGTTAAAGNHVHTGTTISGVDISDDTNLAGTANEITLTGDTLSLHSAITRDAEWDTAAEINTATTDADFQITNATLAFAGFSSLTGRIGNANLPLSAQLFDSGGTPDIAADFGLRKLYNADGIEVADWSAGIEFTDLGVSGMLFVDNVETYSAARVKFTNGAESANGLTYFDNTGFNGNGSGLTGLPTQINDTAFASSWNAVTTLAPTKNAVYDWAHTFDTDDDGLPNKVDSSDGIAKITTNVIGPATAGTDYVSPSGVLALTGFSSITGAVGTGNLPSGATLDTEWDSIAEIETATSANIIINTEIDTASEINALTTDNDFSLTTHTHTTTTVSGLDISDDTNLAGTANEITLTGDTVSAHAALTRDTEWDTAAEINTATTDDDFATLTGAQTLASKTLTSPIINNPTINATVSTGSATFAMDTASGSTLSIPINTTATPFSNANNFSGLIILTSTMDGTSAVFLASGGQCKLIMQSGVNTQFSQTLDNANTTNVYYSSGVVTIQNKNSSGVTQTLTVTAIRTRAGS